MIVTHCTVRDFCARHGIGVTTFYKLVGQGKIAIVKVGARTLVPSDSERAWCESLDAYGRAYRRGAAANENARRAANE